MLQFVLVVLVVVVVIAIVIIVTAPTSSVSTQADASTRPLILPRAVAKKGEEEWRKQFALSSSIRR